METSAKANINIENVSTVTFLLRLLSSLCKQAVRTLAHPGWMQNSVVVYCGWVIKDISVRSVKALSKQCYANLFKLNLVLRA